MLWVGGGCVAKEVRKGRNEVNEGGDGFIRERGEAVWRVEE